MSVTGYGFAQIENGVADIGESGDTHGVGFFIGRVLSDLQQLSGGIWILLKMLLSLVKQLAQNGQFALCWLPGKNVAESQLDRFLLAHELFCQYSCGFDVNGIMQNNECLQRSVGRTAFDAAHIPARGIENCQ